MHAVSKNLRAGFWEWDEIEDRVISYSEEMAAIFNFSLEELYANSQSLEDYYRFVHPDDLEHYKQHISDVKKELRDFRDAHVCEYHLLLSDGTIRYVREMEFGVFDEQGNLERSMGFIQDISENRQTVDDLEKSELRFFSLFDQLPVGVVEEDYRSIKKVVDKLQFKGVENIEEYLASHPRMLREMVEGTSVRNVNQALLEIHRADSKEQFVAMEADLEDWWDAEWVEFYAKEIASLANGDKFHESERIDTRVDDSYFETRTITAVVKGHEKDWRRVITIHEDITSRKQDELVMVEAKELAEKASQAKSEFLSSMSHELRTPLNAILGFSQLFDYDNSLNEQQKSNALEINRAGKHLLVLIDEILDLSRIESGDMEISLEPVPILDVIDDGMAWIENLAKSRDVRIHLDREALSGIQVYADSTRLKQVFLNLLTNAVKYNKESGSIFFELKYCEDSNISIGVRDTGIGIESDKFGELFQPFNRLGAELSNTEGTGIGLVITRQLVGLMQGQLNVESVPGTGTTFWVNLTLVRHDEMERARELSEQREATETRAILQSDLPFILVAEDNAINRDLMAAQMTTLGYQVEYAGNGAEALEKWLSGKYYVLFTDIRMPVMDGYELIREVRSLDITGRHPVSIIAITANAMESDIDKCFAMGADDVISKPVELKTLKHALQKWLPREVVNTEENNKIQPVAMQGGSLINLNVLQQSLGNKPEMHRELLKSFANSLAQATDDIEDAFSWRNHGKLADAAHKLKSSARSMGALELGDLCQLLESAGREKEWAEIESTMPAILAHCQQVKESIHGMGSFQELARKNIIPIRQTEVDLTVPEVDITVLIVDDDFIMHRVTTTMLNDLGINKVLNALSAPKALEIMAGHPEEIELVICDLSMPGMDGIEFMRHLASQNFQNSLILTSGEGIRILRTVEKLAVEHDLHILGVIEKPVTPAKLNEKLEAFDQVTSEGTKILAEVFGLDELVQALEKDQFDVYFQPKVDSKSKQAVGVEALVRWNHPQRGLIRPDAFIAIAEEYGLINQLTEVVCAKSINYASMAQANGIYLNIAINISVDTLSDLDWPDRMAELVEDVGLEHSLITFEITESRLMEHMSVALDILGRLSLKHFNLSIDDFGTGYSSMEQLQRIPFSELKIDRAFVHGAADDNAARAILESSILLAKKLDMKIVAEGVQDQKDWDLLEELEVDLIQGYFISRPLPFDQYIEWLEDWQRNHR